MIYFSRNKLITFIARSGESIEEICKYFFNKLYYYYFRAGESIEECVRREVAEECGVLCHRVTYCDQSQFWPFQASLMIGCIAEADPAQVTNHSSGPAQVTNHSSSFLSKKYLFFLQKKKYSVCFLFLN